MSYGIATLVIGLILMIGLCLRVFIVGLTRDDEQTELSSITLLWASMLLCLIGIGWTCAGCLR